MCALVVWIMNKHNYLFVQKNILRGLYSANFIFRKFLPMLVGAKTINRVFKNYNYNQFLKCK